MARATNVKLRDKVRDTITGYTGIVIAVTEWLNGCGRITVQAQELKDGKPVDSVCFDELQLEIIEPHAEPKPANAEPEKRITGGPRPSPQRSSDPTR